MRILADREAYHASKRFLVLLALGVSPWLVAACAVPILVFYLYLSYKANDRLDMAALRHQGIAPVYRAMQNKDRSFTLFFGLGTADGLAPGDFVQIVAKDGRLLGNAHVESVSRNDAQARLDQAERLPFTFYASRL